MEREIIRGIRGMRKRVVARPAITPSLSGSDLSIEELEVTVSQILGDYESLSVNKRKRVSEDVTACVGILLFKYMFTVCNEKDLQRFESEFGRRYDQLRERSKQLGVHIPNQTYFNAARQGKLHELLEQSRSRIYRDPRHRTKREQERW